LYKLTSYNQIQTEIDEFYFDENIFWQKPIFASPVLKKTCSAPFTIKTRPTVKKVVFPPSGKNLSTLSDSDKQ